MALLVVEVFHLHAVRLKVFAISPSFSCRGVELPVRRAGPCTKNQCLICCPGYRVRANTHSRRIGGPARSRTGGRAQSCTGCNSTHVPHQDEGAVARRHSQQPYSSPSMVTDFLTPCLELCGGERNNGGHGEVASRALLEALCVTTNIDFHPRAKSEEKFWGPPNCSPWGPFTFLQGDNLLLWISPGFHLM